MITFDSIKNGHYAHWKLAYGSYNEQKMLDKLEDIVDSLVSCRVPFDGSEVDQSRNFIIQSFARYEGREKMSRSPFCFVVPTRISRSSSAYASEVHHFLPILKYVDPETRQKMIVGIPPSVIETYQHTGGKLGGSVVFAPLFSDMIQDIKLKPKLLLKLRRITHDTTHFVRDRMGSDIMGLGATLPRLTKLGNNLPTKGLVTTTGHAGTVWLVIKTFEQIVSNHRIDSSKPIGIFGPNGSIGRSIAAMILEIFPESHLLIKDKNHEITEQAANDLRKKYGQKRVIAAKTNDEVLEKSQISISAITSKINLSNSKLDLSGKIIIDDSQPGSFNAQELNSRGAALVWVVGRDGSKDSFLTRAGGYTYGDSGLMNPSDVWGCEAEVAALSKLDRLDLAVDVAINADLVNAMDTVFKEVGITLAEFQEHGRKVDVSHYVSKR